MPSTSAVFYGQAFPVSANASESNASEANASNASYDAFFNAAVSSPENVTRHSLSLAGLLSEALYFYFLESCNGLNCTNSSERNFSTLAAPTPPSYSPPSSSGAGSSSSGSSSGSVSGGGSSGPALPRAPSPSSLISETPSLPSFEFVRVKDEVEALLPELSEEEKEDVQNVLVEAEKLEQQGKTQDALKLLTQAKEQILETIAQGKVKADVSQWPFAGLVLVLLLSAVLAFAFYRWKKQPPHEITPPSKELHAPKEE